MKKVLIFDLDGTLFDPHTLRRAYPDTLEAIKSLSNEHTLLLLTAGKSYIQWDKLMQCGLIGYFNTVMIVPEHGDKREALQSLMRVYPTTSPQLTVVVGDRIDLEITFANELGCTSIRIRRGKHSAKTPATKYERPLHTIASLAELPAIVEGIKV